MVCGQRETTVMALDSLRVLASTYTWPPEWSTADVQDGVLRRYLAASNNDDGVAASMLAETLKWREERGVSDALNSNLADEVLAELTSRDRCFLCGFDTSGRPVFYETVDTALISDLTNAVSPEECLWASIQSMEFMCRCLMPLATRRYGSPVAQFVHVLDLGGISWSGLSHAPVLQLFKSWAAISRAHYPELVAKI
jgi:hypothetical protein